MHMGRTVATTLLTAWLAAAGCRTAPPQRYGMIVGLKEDQVEAYKKLHAHAWPGVLAQIDRSKLRNFSIWLAEVRPHEHMLFGYFEYVGDDFEADMAAMGEDATTRKWWKLTDPMQQPIPTAGPDEQWVMMQEVFYRDATHPGAPLMPEPKRVGVGQAE